MVQPTRMVFWACAAFTLAKTAATAPAAKIHFEAIRIIPAPFFHADRRQRKTMLTKPFMVQTIRQAVGARLGVVHSRQGCVVRPVPRQTSAAEQGETE